jgi:hypothetical protein
MKLRKLDSGERWAGMHIVNAVAEDGTVLARYACPCEWCELWQAAAPMMDAAIMAWRARAS